MKVSSIIIDICTGYLCFPIFRWDLENKSDQIYAGNETMLVGILYQDYGFETETVASSTKLDQKAIYSIMEVVYLEFVLVLINHRL